MYSSVQKYIVLAKMDNIYTVKERSKYGIFVEQNKEANSQLLSTFCNYEVTSYQTKYGKHIYIYKSVFLQSLVVQGSVNFEISLRKGCFCFGSGNGQTVAIIEIERTF